MSKWASGESDCQDVDVETRMLVDKKRHKGLEQLIGSGASLENIVRLTKGPNLKHHISTFSNTLSLFVPGCWLWETQLMSLNIKYRWLNIPMEMIMVWYSCGVNITVTCQLMHQCHLRFLHAYNASIFEELQKELSIMHSPANIPTSDLTNQREVNLRWIGRDCSEDLLPWCPRLGKIDLQQSQSSCRVQDVFSLFPVLLRFFNIAFSHMLP